MISCLLIKSLIFIFQIQCGVYLSMEVIVFQSVSFSQIFQSRSLGYNHVSDLYNANDSVPMFHSYHLVKWPCLDGKTHQWCGIHRVWPEQWRSVFRMSMSQFLLNQLVELVLKSRVWISCLKIQHGFWPTVERD